MEISNLLTDSLTSRPDNSVIIELYRNGYKESGKEFCKKDDTEEHKRFFRSLKEGWQFSQLEM